MQFLISFIKNGRNQKGNLIAPQPEEEITIVNIFDDVSEDEFPNQTVNIEAVHDPLTFQPILNTSSNNIGLQKTKKKKM